MSLPAPIPRPALALGLAGLIPFAAASGVFAFGPPELGGPALLALLGYGATVLSFLGGARWGLEIGRGTPRALVLAVSTLPSLVAWGLLVAPRLDAVQQLSGFIAAFILQWIWDSRDPDAPPWYPRLRTLLTLGATVTLAVALEQAMRL
jgi:hypothetical protein